MLAGLKKFLTRKLSRRRKPWARAFNPTATERDIRGAYRLLLCRNPDPAGWEWFRSFVQTNRPSVRDLVEVFLSSEEFKQLHSASRRLSEGDHVLVDLGAFRMYVPRGDPMIAPGLLAGDYETNVTATLKRFLKPGMVFADLGANLGYFTLLGASLVGRTGKVIACEASPANAALLWVNATLNDFPNVEVHPRALLNRRTMLGYEGCGTNGWVRPVSVQEGLGGVLGLQLVPADPLDAVLTGVERLDVIKMDIEGAEDLALEGGKHTLERHRPVIITEFSPELLMRVSGLANPGKYLERLVAAGYTLAVIGRPDGRLLECGKSTERVLAHYEEEHGPPHCVTHIDVLAMPA